MKKIVFCLVTLSFALPCTSFAEETLSTSEIPKIESSSTTDSTQHTEKSDEKIVDSSLSSTVDTSSTESSGKEYSDLIPTTLIVFQGETLTAEMLSQNTSYHGATLRDLKLLEEASTAKTGDYLVKVSFMLYPLEKGQGEKQKVTVNMGYTVVNASPTYDVQFISYDSQNNQVKGRVLSITGGGINNIPIYGENTINYEVIPKNIKEFYPFAKINSPVLTDSEGYFTLPYQDNFSFAAFSPQSGDYSPIYTLTDKAFTSVTGTTTSSTPTKNTDSSSTATKEEEKKKELFPNTGEKKTVYFSIAGIAIILLAVLFLFIKSKKK